MDDPAAITPEDHELLLTKANEEIYKQNFELSQRNKTLSVLKALYAISISSLDLSDVAQKIVDTIVAELNFSTALISLTDSEKQTIYPIAISHTEGVDKSLGLFDKSLNDVSIPLTFTDNLLVQVINTRNRQITSNLLDILIPNVTQENADEIDNLTHIKTIIVYPLTLGDKVIGTLCVGLGKQVDDLSHAEKETLDQLINVVTIALDRAQLHETLKSANVRLQQLDKLKDEFVSLASHELRTPMTAIKSYVWMVQNNKAGPITDITRKYLDIVYSSVERLIHLVNDMLDISRIESGRFQLHSNPFNFSDLVGQLQTEFKALAEKRNMTWQTDIASPDLQITADRDKILQVMENLVGNAFKFTPDGGSVKVTASINEHQLVVSISDTGRGIAQEDIPKLFTKFTRLGDGLPTFSQPGTGLGLFLSKQFIELHHGQIAIDSTLGQGSTFTFNLPVN